MKVKTTQSKIRIQNFGYQAKIYVADNQDVLYGVSIPAHGSDSDGEGVRPVQLRIPPALRPAKRTWIFIRRVDATQVVLSSSHVKVN